MAYEKSKPASKSEPCPICGKTDNCWSAYYGAKSGWLHYCGAKHCSGHPNVFGRDGKNYVLIDNKRFPGGRSGGYFVYASEEQQLRQREEFIAELKAKNPNYRSSGSSGVSFYQSNGFPTNEFAEVEVIEVDKVEPLPNEKLHKVYDYLLDLLILEPQHKKALLDEWNAGLIDPQLGDKLLKRWKIRSLPMNDYARKNSGAPLRNLTRRDIIQKLVNRFGSLKGVPGFYLETIRWTDKQGAAQSHTHWQMVGTSGIVFPCYDPDGNIIRIRIGDEHPVLEEYAHNPDGSYIYEYTDKRVWNPDGSYGMVQVESHAIAADIRWDYRSGEWIRHCRTTQKQIVLYSRQAGIEIVKLNDKGYPIIDGKVNGKYKNFSSYKRREEHKDGKIYAYNTYEQGCQSGSPISLYTKPGDDMRFVYITEGEKKAMVMNHFLNCPVISIPGVNCFNKLFEKIAGKDYSMLEWLQSRGLKTIVVVYDADKGTNEAVLNAENGLLERCHQEGIETYVGEWDARYGKGADDILILGKRFEYYER